MNGKNTDKDVGKHWLLLHVFRKMQMFWEPIYM